MSKHISVEELIEFLQTIDPDFLVDVDGYFGLDKLKKEDLIVDEYNQKLVIHIC